MRAFRRTEAGIEFRFDPGLVEFLRDVPSLFSALGPRATDPAAQRLSVPVYLDDPEADAEFWRWMGSELEQSRLADRSAFEALLDDATRGTVASRAEAEAFLRVLVEARLVLAARLGVEVEGDYDRLTPEHAAVLGALAELQVLLIDALSGA
jgi:hypothetical protein